MLPRRPRRSLAAAVFLAILALVSLSARAGDEEDDEKEFFRREIAVFEEFPRSFPKGSEVRLKAKIGRSFRAPVLVVVFPDGDAAYLQPDKAAGRDVEFVLRLDGRGGRHRVTLAADGPGGVNFGARFFLMGTADGKPVERDVDLPPEDRQYPPLDPEEHPLRLERILYHRMNALRVKQGLPPLPWHEGVARAAREVFPAIARHYEETFDARTGRGDLVHKVPVMPEGGAGPSIAEACISLLGWTTAQPWLAPDEPARHRPNFVTESLTDPWFSLDAKFEQKFLRKSDLRAPMVSKFLTHAAGAASWRWYGWKGTGAPPAEPPPAPPGKPREVLAALVFVQVNEVRAENGLKRQRVEVDQALSAAKDAGEKAGALRSIGRHAFADSPARLKSHFGSARENEVRAAALDGLWLCAPEEARKLSDPLRVRLAQSLQEKEEGRAAEALALLPLVKYDAATRKEAVRAANLALARGREAMHAAEKAVAAGDREGARALLGAAKARFAGLPVGGEIAAALDALDAPPK